MTTIPDVLTVLVLGLELKLKVKTTTTLVALPVLNVGQHCLFLRLSLRNGITVSTLNTKYMRKGFFTEMGFKDVLQGSEVTKMLCVGPDVLKFPDQQRKFQKVAQFVSNTPLAMDMLKQSVYAYKGRREDLLDHAFNLASLASEKVEKVAELRELENELSLLST